ncbi:formaldehyde dehydrogenase [Natrialba chahannaoensis JCM 10990]|uniref:Formaldehyde dehydrogenase n=1 Tax=Natrialba chahannaoensis JCM 10990 TaxID=1227492 RepID=M0ALP1_9EURY|nr:formaldehyde dehydrogenase [Natrialba chahannaoensis JCM 10990]
MLQTIKGVVYRDSHGVPIEEIDERDIEHPNDALFNVTTVAICSSDLHMLKVVRGQARNCSSTTCWSGSRTVVDCL